MSHALHADGPLARWWMLPVGTLITGVLIALSSGSAAAATFTVTATTDAADEDLLDGDCDTAGLTTVCTLRAAIQQANATPGADTIGFAIGGPGPRKILADPLPAITEGLVIDGYTQSGTAENTAAAGTNATLRVVLDGPGNGIGLDIQAAGVTVRGLVIQDFGDGIRVGGQGAVITGSFIGTDASGTLGVPNARHGIIVQAGDARIGGRRAADRVLVSGNSGNGIQLGSEAAGAVVQGILVGTERDGRSPLGNGGHGIEATGTQGALVGGDTAAKANVIRSNDGDGIAVTAAGGGSDASGVRILRNTLSANVGLGIDIQDDGVTPNDPGDTDGGPNARQNFPVLRSAVSGSTRTTIRARLDSVPNTTFVIQFFSNSSGNEAQAYIGQRTVTTGAGGEVSFSFVPGSRVAPGRYVTATATNDSTGETSELSARRKVTRP